MKKAALILALLMSTGAVFAYMQEYTTSDIKTLQGTNFSQETLKVVDKARMLTQGYERDYVPYFSRKYYSDKPFLKWYTIVRNYIDPASNENVFGIREVQFRNAWFDTSPSYLAKDSPNDMYQRLFEKDIKRLEVAGKIIKGSDGIEPAVEDVRTDTSGDFVLEDL